jgi:uncharacterized protein (DUF433 family)
MTTATPSTILSRDPTSAASWISKTPGVCGGRACIRDTRITVWGLMAWKREGLSDSEVLEQIQGLRAEDLEVAWKYAAEHPREIEKAIRENEDV